MKWDFYLRGKMKDTGMKKIFLAVAGITAASIVMTAAYLATPQKKANLASLKTKPAEFALNNKADSNVNRNYKSMSKTARADTLKGDRKFNASESVDETWLMSKDDQSISFSNISSSDLARSKRITEDSWESSSLTENNKEANKGDGLASSPGSSGYEGGGDAGVGKKQSSETATDKISKEESLASINETQSNQDNSANSGENENSTTAAEVAEQNSQGASDTTSLYAENPGDNSQATSDTVATGDNSGISPEVNISNQIGTNNTGYLYETGVDAFNGISGGINDTLNLGYDSEQIKELTELYVQGKEGLNPSPITIDGITWYFTNDPLSDHGFGEAWTEGSSYYVKLGSGITGKEGYEAEGNPEPMTVISALLGMFGFALKKFLVKKA